jgi:glycosyltransferase involved in cell wall biosynthesis
MKLAFVTQYFPPEFLGGVEVVVRAHARALEARGHRLTIVTGTDQPHAGVDVLEREHEGLAVRVLARHPHERYSLELARPRLRDLTLALVRDAELVHVHHWSTLSSDLVRAVSERAPVVVSLHDLFVTCPRFFRVSPRAALVCPERGDFEPCAACIDPEAGGMPRTDRLAGLRARARGFEAELERAARILVPSRSHARRLEPLLGPAAERLQVLGHGHCRDLARFSKQRAGWDGARPLRVLHCGNLCREKGTLDLVQSLATLPTGKLELVLAGRVVGPEFEAELRAAAGALALELSGEYDAHGLARVAATCDLAAFPTRICESYGLVLDEVLSLGLPAWISDRGAMGERLGGAGRVLPAQDVAAWSAAFLSVLRDPAALEAERASVPERLTDGAERALELEQVYAEVLAGKQP